MSLFEVKGWEVPHRTGIAGSPSQPSKKRKRPGNDAGKVQSAQVNVEKLMRKVEKGAFGSRNEQKKKRRNGQRTEDLQVRSIGSSDDHRTISRETKSRVKARAQSKKGEGMVESVVEEPSNTANPPPKRVKKKGSGMPTASRLPHAIDDGSSPSHKKKLARLRQPSGGLTSLQVSMKDTLDGARFRCRQTYSFVSRF
jgi:ribosomal RNA-processing protein 8